MRALQSLPKSRWRSCLSSYTISADRTVIGIDELVKRQSAPQHNYYTEHTSPRPIVLNFLTYDPINSIWSTILFRAAHVVPKDLEKLAELFEIDAWRLK